ncbi:MAG: efflux RND transporter permease subunit, partial [Pseudomonadota bacterium]
MGSRSFSQVFVDRPILAAVISILILVAGLVAIPNLPVSEYPQVAPPTIQVTARYPGANPTTIAETVAAPLEEAITGVEYMSYMKSASSSDGTVLLFVTFDLDADIDLAAIQVQNRVAQALPRLPEAVRNLGVTTLKASPNITMVVHLLAEDGAYDDLYLSNLATLRVRDEIARIEGVGQTQVFGAGDYAMRIWIDPEQAAQRGLTASDIVNA